MCFECILAQISTDNPSVSWKGEVYCCSSQMEVISGAFRLQERWGKSTCQVNRYLPAAKGKWIIFLGMHLMLEALYGRVISYSHPVECRHRSVICFDQ